MPDGSYSAPLPVLGELYRAHFAFVRRVLRRCGVLESELDDAVQETFLVVHRRLADFEGRSTERTWLYAIAIRVASTFRRRRTREQARRARAGDDMHGTPVLDPEAELSRVEAAQLLEVLLSELDDSKRTVFVLAELEGIKAPEISRILDVNVRTIHSRLRLARQRFDAVLSRHRAVEAGRARRAHLIARRLADRADPANENPAGRRAAWAALAISIEEGATPITPGWETLALGKAATASLLPVAATFAVAAAALAVVVAGAADDDAAPADVAKSGEVEGAGHSAKPTRSGEALPQGHAASAGEGSVAPPEPRSAVAVSPAPATVSSAAAATSTAAATAAATATSVAKAKSTSTSTSTSTSKSKSKNSGSDLDSEAPAQGGAGGATDVSTLGAETRLIERARKALVGGRAKDALAALDEHARSFKDGLLASERRSTRIKALCSAGREKEATALAKRLDGKRPNGRYHRVLATACRS